MRKQIQLKEHNRLEKRSFAGQNLFALILLSIFCLLILQPGAFGFSKKKPPEKIEYDREIRVALGMFDSLTISSSGEMIIECYRDGECSEIYYTSSDINFAKNSDGLYIEDPNGILATGLSKIICRPRFPNVFLDHGDKRYRGLIECYANKIKRGKYGPIEVYNLIDIELYLRGVLPAEIGERNESEYEAAKAQAIAARTYAVWKLSTQQDNKHLKNSIHDQVYLGANAELSLLNKAISETEGIIMISENKPIAAYYHAVCGGSTAPIEKIWANNKVPYLKGGVDGDYCQWAHTFYWTEEFSKSDLRNNLTKYFGKLEKLPSKGFGQIQSIEFKKDDSIGRMVEMKIETSTGSFKVKSDQIRWALMRPSKPGAILPSTRFNANVVNKHGEIESLKLVGAGNGHGIGMCQCGAIGRARSGEKAGEILRRYYKDIELTKIY